MRLIGGERKGVLLNRIKGRNVRPALARVRGALFNILGATIVGEKVLDLFAGTGSIGLEALSRGAALCAFVEQDRQCIRTILQNLEKLGFTSKARVFHRDAFLAPRFLLAFGSRYDILNAMPPYYFFTEPAMKERMHRLLQDLVRSKIMAPEGRLIVEHRAKDSLWCSIENFGVYDERIYGQTALSFYKKES